MNLSLSYTETAELVGERLHPANNLFESFGCVNAHFLSLLYSASILTSYSDIEPMPPFALYLRTMLFGSTLDSLS